MQAVSGVLRHNFGKARNGGDGARSRDRDCRCHGGEPHGMRNGHAGSIGSEKIPGVGASCPGGVDRRDGKALFPGDAPPDQAAGAAFNQSKKIWKEEPASETTEMEKYQASLFFAIGEPNNAYARYFSGNSYLASVSDSPVSIHNVTFEPGCQNNWHIHHAKSGGGQILICVGGKGWYQEWGKDPVVMKPGDCINIPVGIKHWHGAAEDSWFSHLAIEVPGLETATEWLESSK